MTGIRNPFDIHKYLNSKRVADGTAGAEVVIEERIRLWKKNALIKQVERIFPITGFPGVGKTWLFQYFCVGKRKGIYLDLDGFSDVDTPEEYLNQVLTRLQQSGRFLQRGKNLFFIDHVPSPPLHSNLKKVEDEILIPELDQGALIFIAQQNPNSVCWNRLPRTIPYNLQGFDKSSRKKLFRKMKISEPKKNQPGYALFATDILFPGLVAAWGIFHDLEDGELQAIECFMKYWLSQVVPFKPFELQAELRLTGALTWVDSFLDNEKIINILRNLKLGDSNHLNVRDKLADYQLTTVIDTLVEPVRTVLQLWLKQKDPALASRIEQDYGG